MRGYFHMKTALLALMALFIGFTGSVLAAPEPPQKITAAEVLARLTPHLKVNKPNGSGPFKTVLVFHGAKRGPAWDERYQILMNQFTKLGYASVFVDMFTGRGDTNGSKVFSGKILPTQTASDVMVLSAWVKDKAWVDKNNIAAVGYSWGAATLMDALTLSKDGRTPQGILDRPKNGANYLRSVVLIAPWCKRDMYGLQFVASTHKEFGAKVPVLAILPEADDVSDISLCKKILRRNIDVGHTVQTVLLEGAEHRFYFKWTVGGSYEEQYDQEMANLAKNKVNSFLKSHWK